MTNFSYKTTGLTTWILLIIVYTSNSIYAQDIEQTNKANAIVNNYTTLFEVHSLSRATMNVTLDLTIINKSGEDYAVFDEYYDSFRNVKIKKAILYNSSGKKIKKIKKSKFIDASLGSSFSLYDDNRIVYYKPHYSHYPYTIHYEYKIDYSGLLSYPNWSPYLGYNTMVKNATFKIIIPKNMSFHYKAYNSSGPENITDDKKNEIYEWSFSGLPAIEKEPLSLPYFRVLPNIKTAPDVFKIGGYEGNLTSWKKFGLWNAQLLEGRNSLPQHTKNKILELIDTIDQTREKVEKIYQFMQNKTRYVSIQLGIGGWQPFEASKVDNLGYGDCKALTNYTKALLDVAEINSYYSLVRAGNNTGYFDQEFPSNQFNHVILCVPNKGDTIWLECTSKTLPAGYLGKFTSNRKALLITEEGGKLTNTPNYKTEDNGLNLVGHFKIDSEGKAKVQITSKYTGLRFSHVENQKNKSPKKQKEWLLKNMGINNFNIKSYNYSTVSDNNPVGVEHLKLNIKNYAVKTGNRLFLTLNKLNKLSDIPDKLSSRNTRIYLNSSSHDKDSIVYFLPENYEIEYMPNDNKIKSVFGQYSVKIQKLENKILYVREYKRYKGIFSSKRYKELRNFMEKIKEADNYKVVLVKRE